MNDDTRVPLTTYPFAFTGRPGEYFRIWIVSLFLSIFTLGIYSAWGKVRKKGYLYAHTLLAGDGFDFRASPLAVLKGRCIALLLFGGLALTGHFLPQVQLAFIILLVLLTPWIVVATSRFNARNSAWRNVTFAFDGTIREAAKVFLGFGLIGLVTVGLGIPYARMRRAQFVVERHRFGATPLAADLAVGGFIVAYLFALLMLVGAVVLFGVAIGISMATAAHSHRPRIPATAIIVLTVFLYAAYIAAFAYLQARVGNLVWNGVVIGRLRCRSTLRARDLAWLYVSNVVAVLATLGLATAWVTIRMLRYRAQNLLLVGAASTDSFASATGRGSSATGSEVGDLFDVDVSL